MAGIIGYGIYIPRYRITATEIARVWGEDGEKIKQSLGIFEKSVPNLDEDASTFAVEAARNALKFAQLSESRDIEAIFVGSESHPYAVKPTASIVAQAINASSFSFSADLEFACKAGTAGIQCVVGLCESGLIKYGMAIGTDTSQGRPGDALEYTAGAGAAAYIIGKEDGIAKIEATCSYTTDTPDFWRRPGAEFPSHGGRFTGEPAYFKHITSAAKRLFEKTGFSPKDFDFAVFHQPNGKFPLIVAKILGIDCKKVEQGLVTPWIGNTYSAASLIGLASVLDVAQPGQRVLLVSFGSGAGSDAFSLLITDEIIEKREEARKNNVKTLKEMISEKQYLDYGLYVKHRKKLKNM
ncbi:MAG: hydroxymethylglutaryl-CoA synthase [archaeon]